MNAPVTNRCFRLHIGNRHKVVDCGTWYVGQMWYELSCDCEIATCNADDVYGSPHVKTYRLAEIAPGRERLHHFVFRAASVTSALHLTRSSCISVRHGSASLESVSSASCRVSSPRSRFCMQHARCLFQCGCEDFMARLLRLFETPSRPEIRHTCIVQHSISLAAPTMITEMSGSQLATTSPKQTGVCAYHRMKHAFMLPGETVMRYCGDGTTCVGNALRTVIRAPISCLSCLPALRNLRLLSWGGGGCGCRVRWEICSGVFG